MLFPVVCVTCNNAIGGKHPRYVRLVTRYALEGHSAEQVVDSATSAADFRALANEETCTAEDAALRALGIRRYCCRRHFLTEIDLLEGDPVRRSLEDHRRKDAAVRRRRRDADGAGRS